MPLAAGMAPGCPGRDREPGVVRQPGQPLRVWVLGPDTLTSRSDLASAQDPEHQALRILGVLKAIKSRLGYG